MARGIRHGAGGERRDGAADILGLSPSTDRREAAFEQGTVSSDLPTFEIPRGTLQEGVQLAALAADAGLAASRGEARRLAQGGGLRLNDEAVTDATRLVNLDDLRDGTVKLAAGKKKIVLVKPV